MQLHQLGQGPGNKLTPSELCDLVEQDYHLAITASCDIIGKFLSGHPNVPGLSEASSELLHLLFGKVDDELKHILLKEAGIMFPCIRKRRPGESTLCVKHATIEVIKNNQSVVTELMQKIRKLLNNFVPKPAYTSEWKNCINAFFLLESSVFQWIHVEQNILYPAVQQSQAKTKKIIK